jgi:isopentenyldiphosphate isomerase
MDAGPAGEVFDVYDEEGNPTGETEHRDVIHARGLWHGTVHIWIHDEEGNVLLQQRAETKDLHPCFWDASVAGHREPDEEPIPAALREMEEEIGVTVPPERLAFLTRVRKTTVGKGGSFINREISWVYLLQGDGDIRKLNPNPEEVSAVRFFSTDEIRYMLKNPDDGMRLVPHGDDYYTTVLDKVDETVRVGA